MLMHAKCGHVEEKLYADAHHGLCRKCQSNFAYLLDLEQNYGEDAVIQYWYARLLLYSSTSAEIDNLNCFLDHLINFYQQNYVKYPSKRQYIRKMLFMLHSLQHPVNFETLR